MLPYVGQEMLTLPGTPDFTPFGEFMISLIHYIYTLYINELVSFVGLFAWISLTAWSLTYFISHGVK